MNNIFAVVEKNSNRLISIIDKAIIEFYSKNLPIFDIVEIKSTGTSMLSVDGGIITTVTVSTKNRDYYMIDRYPEKYSLAEAYEIIKN